MWLLDKVVIEWFILFYLKQNSSTQAHNIFLKKLRIDTLSSSSYHEQNIHLHLLPPSFLKDCFYIKSFLSSIKATMMAKK